MIHIEVHSTRAVIRSQEPLTVGLTGATARFSFGKPWESLIKTAVFRQGEKTVAAADIGTEVTIPWEVLTQPGVPVEIGVYGRDSTGKLAIPTVWAVTQPVRTGTDPDADPSAEPTPGLWEQMQGKLGNLEQLDTDDQSSLVAAINEANRPVRLVTVTPEYPAKDGKYQVDYDCSDIRAWINNGYPIACHMRVSDCDVMLHLADFRGGSYITFTSVSETVEYNVSISDNGFVSCTVEKLAKAENVPSKTSDLKNDSGFLTEAPVTSVNGQIGDINVPVPLRITVAQEEDGSYASDKYAAWIMEAYNAGHTVYCQYGSRVLALLFATDSVCVFGCVHGSQMHTVSVSQSTVTVTTAPLDSGDDTGKDGITPHIGANGNWFIGETDTGMPSRGEPGQDAPKEAVLYTRQDLTPEQKVQARQNIGAAGNLEIEVIINEVGAELVGESVKTVFEAVDNGNTVALYRTDGDSERIYYQFDGRSFGSDGSESISFAHKSVTLVQEIILTRGGVLGGTFGSVSVGTEILNAQEIGAVPAPLTASIGQALSVSEVDENGKPTEWKAIDFPAGSGGGNASICNFTITADQEVNGITVELPTTLTKFCIIEFRIVFGEVLSQPMTLYSRQGNGSYNGYGSALPENTKAATVFGLRFSDEYLHIGFNSAITYEANAFAKIPSAALRISQTEKTITFYSNTSGVNFPAGTSISVWGVYEK